MPRQRRRLGQRNGVECEPDERVAQVVQPDLLAPLVQPGRVAGGVDRPERVATALWPAARRDEHERVGVDEPEVATGLPRAERAQLTQLSPDGPSSITLLGVLNLSPRIQRTATMVLASLPGDNGCA